MFKSQHQAGPKRSEQVCAGLIRSENARNSGGAAENQGRVESSIPPPAPPRRCHTGITKSPADACASKIERGSRLSRIGYGPGQNPLSGQRSLDRIGGLFERCLRLGGADGTALEGSCGEVAVESSDKATISILREIDRERNVEIFASESADPDCCGLVATSVVPLGSSLTVNP
jgi:hypothetical protein